MLCRNVETVDNSPSANDSKTTTSPAIHRQPRLVPASLAFDGFKATSETEKKQSGEETKRAASDRN